jgi:hypothetical protein
MRVSAGRLHGVVVMVVVTVMMVVRFGARGAGRQK